MKQCPHCGCKIFCLDSYCPYCKMPIKDYFTIEVFLKENFHLFTIIGVMGTMISLLPNLGNALFGINWISKESFSLFTFFFTLIIYFCGFLITIIFYIVIIKIFECRSDERYKLICDIPIWYQGDLQRIFLLACIVPMMVGFFFFLIPSVIAIPNNNIILTMFLLFFAFSVVYLFIQFKILQHLIESIFDFTSYFGSDWRRIIALLTLILVVGALLIFQILNPPAFMVPKPYSNSSIQIHTNHPFCSPWTSSPQGLELQIIGITSDQISHTAYNWSTNYGYFVYYTPSGMEEQILGNTCTIEPQKIFWTYPQEDIGYNKSPVNIDLRVVNLINNSSVVNKTLHLTWFTKDIVYVNTTDASF